MIMVEVRIYSPLTGYAELSLSQLQYSVVEDDSSLTATITLTHVICEDAVVEVNISDGSAYGNLGYVTLQKSSMFAYRF